MNTVVVAECPLESWHLLVQVKVDAVKHPDKECWPKGKLRVSVAERADFTGAVSTESAQLADTGVAPAVTPIAGGPTQKDLWIKVEPEDGAPWANGAPEKVTVKPHQSTSVVLPLEPTGGGLEVLFSRSDGKPLVKQLAFKLRGTESKDGLSTVDGKRLLSPLKPGDYTVEVADLGALLLQEGPEGWKLGPEATGVLKAKVELGKVARVELHLTRYAKAQFVAFDIKPGLSRDKSGAGTGYLGASTTFEDMGRRYLLMKKAMQTAAAAGVSADEDVLKIFMAPEFYWRGRDGAYLIEQVSDIMELLRPEAQKADYKDWIFVYGTAIGYFQHGDGKGAQPFKLQVKSTGSWMDGGLPQLTTVNVVADPGLKRSKRSPANVCARIQQNAAKPIRWQVSQGRGTWWPWGAMTAGIVKSEKVSDDEYKLYLDNQEDFAQGTIALRPAAATEVFNLALIQRGGPPAKGGGLTEAIVYKEFISHIDFLGGTGKTFYKDDGSGRSILIHGAKARTVLPTQGSTDKLGTARNTPGLDGVTEVNKSGLGGGSLFTMEGISFGMEVCRDHCVNRLHDYLTKHARPGEPKPQIHLIPCWGMSIDLGPVCTVKDGLVFLVDGPKGPDACVVGEPRYSCPKHPADFKKTFGDCAKDDYFECKDHGHFAPAAGDCPVCNQPLKTTPRFVCAGPHELSAGTAGVAGVPAVPDCPECGDPTREIRVCLNCFRLTPTLNACIPCAVPVQTIDLVICEKAHEFAVATDCCGKPAVDQTTHFCSNHPHRADAAGPCLCGKAMTPGHFKLRQDWTRFAPGGPTPVPDVTESVTINKTTKRLSTDQAAIFERDGAIKVYPVKPIPPGQTF